MLHLFADVDLTSPVTLGAIALAAIAAVGAAWNTTVSYLDRRDQRKHNKGLAILKREFKKCHEERLENKAKMEELEQRCEKAERKADRMEGRLENLAEEAKTQREESERLRALFREKLK